mmetsp:Transcript_17672/g.44144  ORF Transcript_17672/g.44144 Transcript_17672/m.44144 type:complete len:282 (-) Transcript_17672:1922-2767(-)
MLLGFADLQSVRVIEEILVRPLLVQLLVAGFGFLPSGAGSGIRSVRGRGRRRSTCSSSRPDHFVGHFVVLLHTVLELDLFPVFQQQFPSPATPRVRFAVVRTFCTADEDFCRFLFLLPLSHDLVVHWFFISSSTSVLHDHDLPLQFQQSALPHARPFCERVVRAEVDEALDEREFCVLPRQFQVRRLQHLGEVLVEAAELFGAAGEPLPQRGKDAFAVGRFHLREAVPKLVVAVREKKPLLLDLRQLRAARRAGGHVLIIGMLGLMIMYCFYSFYSCCFPL